MGTELSLEELRERLTPLFRDKGLRFALVFGSAALGQLHKQSDVDLAFSFDEPTDIISLTNRVIRLLHTDRVDVVDLKRAAPLLRYSAVKTGKLLYERTPGLYHEFCSLAFRMYADTKKLRDAQAQAIGQFLAVREVL
jgi:predicted nucleotidyltransferase